MPEASWLESRNKKSRWYGYIFFLIIVLAAAFIFLRNNRDVLFSKPGHSSQEAEKPPSPKPAARTLPPQPTVMAKAVVTKRAVPLPETDSVELPDIACRLRGTEPLTVVLSLDLFFQAGSLKREVLLKRENLKVMVQKAIAGKSMNDLIVDSLREQTKSAMNRILEKGVIRDVVFRKFSIDKVQ
jgi:flagellar basal body-associated protein FliL